MLVILVVSKIILGVNIKKIKELSQKNELDKLITRLPDTLQMGKEMLEMLGNSNVTIEKNINEKSGTSLYLVMGNKIIIANGNGSYATVQTLAHECLHSVQNKKTLWFNFIYSNFYIIYTFVVVVMTALGIIKNTTVHLYILALFGFVFYAIRSYLEIDAMTKAKFLAKEYLEKKGLHNENEINMLIEKYEEINKIGIPTTNYFLIWNVISKLLVYSVIAYVF